MPQQNRLAGSASSRYDAAIGDFRQSVNGNRLISNSRYLYVVRHIKIIQKLRISSIQDRPNSASAFKLVCQISLKSSADFDSSVVYTDLRRSYNCVVRPLCGSRKHFGSNLAVIELWNSHSVIRLKLSRIDRGAVYRVSDLPSTRTVAVPSVSDHALRKEPVTNASDALGKSGCIERHCTRRGRITPCPLLCAVSRSSKQTPSFPARFAVRSPHEHHLTRPSPPGRHPSQPQPRPRHLRRAGHWPRLGIVDPRHICRRHLPRLRGRPIQSPFPGLPGEVPDGAGGRGSGECRGPSAARRPPPSRRTPCHLPRRDGGGVWLCGLRPDGGEGRLEVGTTTGGWKPPAPGKAARADWKSAPRTGG